MAIVCTPSRLSRLRRLFGLGVFLTSVITVLLCASFGSQSQFVTIQVPISTTSETGGDSGHMRRHHDPHDSHGIPCSLESLWPSKAGPTDNGYKGKGVTMNVSALGERDKAIYTGGYRTHRVNQLASDMIPLRREILLDIPECEKLQARYRPADLPTASVVLPMHNEMWSSLLRTVFSILDAGPYQLIREVVIVDDASTNADLGVPLESYIKIFGGKVKLLRLPERSGLIKARLRGCEQTTGDVIVILDAHCEVHKGWLEPLLDRIRQDDRVIAIPDITEIAYDTYQVRFSNGSSVNLGGLTLDLAYAWQGRGAVVGVDRQTVTDPIPTPTHLGCCLAISRSNFERLGRYDPGLDIWGCENQELSFKAWMCGGRMEIIPCSHVAHLFRKSFPYTWGNGSALTLLKNCMRVAEVWMDDYKQFYYHRIGLTPKSVTIGDLSDRQALRRRLQCRSFHWYVKEVYPSLFVPLNTSAMGSISSVALPTSCLEMSALSSGWGGEPALTPCRPADNRQYFVLTREGQLRRDEECLTRDTNSTTVRISWCGNLGSEALWVYSKEDTIESAGTGSEGDPPRCLTLSPDTKSVHMERCKIGDARQKWRWPRKSIHVNMNYG